VTQRFLIEENIPFRSSLLWELQDQAYSTFGPSAWSEKGVPSYLTSHPLLAQAYAEQIRAFFRDAGLKSATIVDIGAGTGRLAFYLLEELKDLNIDYILTDITEAHLDALRLHPKLKPYFQSKRLSTYLYHHSKNSPPLPTKPTIVIANYYLDTLPQTLYRASNGNLEEGYVTLHSSHEKSIESIADLEATYTYKPAKNPQAQEYAAIIENGIFLEPHGGLATLTRYMDHNQPLLIFTADQGVTTQAQMQQLSEPKIAKHGTFSFTVHYHYLKFLIEKMGLSVLLPQIPDETLVFMTATNHLSDGLIRAFKTTIDSHSPCDYFHISNALESANPNLKQMISLIKSGAYDPINAYLFFPKITKLAKDTELKPELVQLLTMVARTFFPINAAEAAFYNEIGVLLFQLKHFAEALICFQQVLHFSPATPEILQNIAACMARL
jgi:tetratricopeptide (TPR) repeat protein